MSVFTKRPTSVRGSVNYYAELEKYVDALETEVISRWDNTSLWICSFMGLIIGAAGAAFVLLP